MTEQPRKASVRTATVLAIAVVIVWTGARVLAEQQPATTQAVGVGAGPGGCTGSSPKIEPGRMILSNNSLYTLITMAYGLDCGDAQATGMVSGGPEWIKTDPWVIQALIPEATALKASAQTPFILPGVAVINDPQLRQLLQNVLAERFKLVVHRETKEGPVYELTVVQGGAKLQHSEQASCRILNPQAFVLPKPGDKPYCMFSFNGSVAGFAAVLRGFLSLDRLVIDKTGISGVFDFGLIWTRDPLAGQVGVPGLAPSDPSVPSVFAAIQDQLGLKLESAKGSVDVLVIDSVQRPSEN